MNKGITIKARIGLTMTFLAALLAAISVLGLIGLTRANDALKNTFTNQMPSAVSIANSEVYAARERLALDRAAFLIGTSEVAATVERAKLMRTESDNWWKKYLALPRGAEEDRLAQVVAGRREALHTEADAFTAMVNAGDQSKIADSAKRLQKVYNNLVNADSDLVQLQFQQAKEGYDSTQSMVGFFRMTSIGALVVGLGAALFSFFTLRGAIARPLAEALGHFDAIAAGDLRRAVVVRSRDEMGQLMEGVAKMQKSLIDTVRTVRAGSESIATATRQIAAGNIDLSSRTEEQASALQETASSMDELTGTVRQNADNARQASALAANASEIANKGNAVVSQVVGTMGDINQSSAKIADIIAIIEGIAFQTNILALNAAVEAARAGEAGRSFAVVAGEVRMLAQRCAASAKEIKEVVEASVNEVAQGTQLVARTTAQMRSIDEAVARVSSIIMEVANASGEQAEGIRQVNQAVSHLDSATQQNAALVEQAAATATRLVEQADVLDEAVRLFTLPSVASNGKPTTSGSAFRAKKVEAQREKAPEAEEIPA